MCPHKPDYLDDAIDSLKMYVNELKSGSTVFDPWYLVALSILLRHEGTLGAENVRCIKLPYAMMEMIGLEKISSQCCSCIAE